MKESDTQKDLVVRRCTQEGCSWSVSGTRDNGLLDRVKALVKHLASEHSEKIDHEEMPELHRKVAYALAELDSLQWGATVPGLQHPFWGTYYAQAYSVLQVIDDDKIGVTRNVEVWPLRRVLEEVSCGSGDWSWDEEWSDLDERHVEDGYLDELRRQIKERGIDKPILIGNDGRLWNGHHRLRIAVQLGIEYVPVELA